jgi:type I restriction enzyme S subunit
MDMAVGRVEQESDGPWLVPEGWCWAAVSELPIGGSGSVEPFRTPDEPFVLYSVPAFERKTPEYVKGEQVESNKQFIPLDAVLVCKINPRINRVWRVKAHNPSEGKVIASTEWIVIQPHSLIEPDYLRHYLSTERVRQYLAANVSGVGGSLMRVNAATVGGIRFPLAPLGEQRRIVARIDALFAEIAEGEEALAAARKGLDTFRRALLKSAVTGELTKEWRANNPVTETGHDLLARIAKSRAAKAQARGRGKRAADAPPLDTTALPALPEGWAWGTLGQLFVVTTGSTPSRSDPTLWNGDIPWVSSGEVAFCRIRSTNETISRAGLGNADTRLNPAGTVLLAMIGEGKTRGQCAILDVAAANNQNAAAIRVSGTPIPPEFVYHVLEERYFRSRRESQGGNQPALNGGKVAEMAIPLPPLGEIAEIVRRVSDALAAAADTQAMLDAEAADAARLKQSILKAAFEGRLVPQDLADEPASAVLAGLKAIPSTATPAKRGRRAKTSPDRS